MYANMSTQNPLGKRPWNFATSNSGLSFYAAQNFPVPYVSRGLGNFVTDMSTLPPAPSGEQYVTPPGSVLPQLQAIPKNPEADAGVGLLVLAAGSFALWLMSNKGKKMPLPTVLAAGANLAPKN